MLNVYSKATINVSSYDGLKPENGSSPAPSGPPPKMDPTIVATASQAPASQPAVAKTTYEPDDNGTVSKFVLEYLNKLGDRYPALKKIDQQLVANVLNQAEGMVKKGLGLLNRR